MVDYVSVDLVGFTSTGASVSNVVYRDLDYRRLRATTGGVARFAVSEAVIPSLRLGYAWRDGRGDRAATVLLAAAQHGMATQTMALPVAERDHVVAKLGVQMSQAGSASASAPAAASPAARTTRGSRWTHRWRSDGAVARVQQPASHMAAAALCHNSDAAGT